VRNSSRYHRKTRPLFRIEGLTSRIWTPSNKQEIDREGWRVGLSRAPCVSSMRKSRSPHLEIRPRWRVPPEECSLGVNPNHEAKCRASLKCDTAPLVAATIAVAVNKPTPGIENRVTQAG
jgi:hypothetical protein